MTKVTRFTMDNNAGGEKRRLHLREISGDSDAPLGTVGQDLRAARLRLGDDLATVSSTLKIRKEHLEALEEDRLEALPGRTYAIGFVRSYATYLGLDAAEYLERFKQEIAGRGENSPHLAPYIDPGERRLPQGWQLIAVAFAALLIFGVYLIVKAVSTDSSPSVAPVPTEIINAAQPPAPPHPVPVPQPTQTVPPTAAAVSAAPAPAASRQPAEALPIGHQYGQQNEGSRILLRAHKQVYVTVKGEAGTVYISRTLYPGDTYRVPNLPGLELAATDASAVELVLDGSSAGAIGSQAKPVEAMPLNPQTVADRRNAAPAE